MKIRILIGLCALAVFAADATAESIPAETLTLGWPTEHAEAVLIADLGDVTAKGVTGRREASFVVREPIRGATAAGETITLVFPDLGHGAPWLAGARHLLFVSRIDGPADAPVRWRPIPGTAGIRVIRPGTVSARFPGMVKQIAATLAMSGPKVEEPAKLLSLLVGWLGDADAGIVRSAALDLVRHRKHHAQLTDAQRASVLSVFRDCGVHRPGKGSLAMAAAMTNPDTAGRPLVDSLLLPGSRRIRGEVGDALVLLGDPKVPTMLVKALPDADTEHLETVVQVLGRVGGAPEVAAVREQLRSLATTVRIEAAHALGRMARRVRKEDPEARIDARVELYRRVLAARAENELRACLWAMAQLDDPTAWDNLRRLSTDDHRLFVRRVAKRYLETPRVSLELR